MGLKREITPDKELQNYSYLGERYKKDSVYKYINLDTVVLCLKNKSIRFVQPSQWKDKYEMRFYKADFSKLDVPNDFHPQLYACCFTRKKMSEAAWKIYASDNAGLGTHCVKFTIDLNKLRRTLSNYAILNNCKVYESQMIYSLTDEEINDLHKFKSDYYENLFEKFSIESYLTLLSIKRPAFSHESELRFFIVPSDQQSVNDFIDITLPWDKLVSKISVDKHLSMAEREV